MAAKRQDGTPLASRVDALPPADLVQSGPYLLPPRGAINKDQVVPDAGAHAAMEIKEWQAIMNYLKSLATKNAQGVTILAVDERAHENRSVNIKA